MAALLYEQVFNLTRIKGDCIDLQQEDIALNLIMAQGGKEDRPGTFFDRKSVTVLDHHDNLLLLQLKVTDFPASPYVLKNFPHHSIDTGFIFSYEPEETENFGVKRHNVYLRGYDAESNSVIGYNSYHKADVCVKITSGLRNKLGEKLL